MDEEELMITRVLAHPRDVVFAAWTNASELVKWFAPKECQLVVRELDIRAGGHFHWCVRNPRYPDCWCTGEFLQIEQPSLIRYRIRLADEQGNPVTAKQALKEDGWPDETLVTVEFREEGDHTRLVIRQRVVAALAKKTGAYQGWVETLDLLEERLLKVQSIL